MVITMKIPTYKQNKSYEYLLNRIQRKAEIKKQIISILSSEENLAIADIQKKIGLNRNTFNYWIKLLEKEGWFKRKKIEGIGTEITGQPKTLILNKKKLKEMEKLSSKHWKNHEEYMLKSIFVDKILDEIEKKQPSDKQHEGLIELFKQFGKESYGAKSIFLLYDDDLVKVDYKLSLTDKGRAYLKRHKRQ